jgi:hypothetical protein
MTRKSLPIAFYLLLVFISGAVVGALGYRTYNPPTARGVSSPVDWRKAYIEESKERLGLSTDQVTKLTAILDDTNARFHQAREQENQEIRQIKEEHIARVRAMLSDEQRPKYDQLHAEREARAKQQEDQKKKQ